MWTLQQSGAWLHDREWGLTQDHAGSLKVNPFMLNAHDDVVPKGVTLDWPFHWLRQHHLVNMLTDISAKIHHPLQESRGLLGIFTCFAATGPCILGTVALVQGHLVHTHTHLHLQDRINAHFAELLELVDIERRRVTEIKDGRMSERLVLLEKGMRHIHDFMKLLELRACFVEVLNDLCADCLKLVGCLRQYVVHKHGFRTSELGIFRVPRKMQLPIGWNLHMVSPSV